MNNIDMFLQFAESLKLVRKADIEYDGVDVIDNIYTDLLPQNGIINKVNLPRTTLLVGRKGTGKSTIFQKSQKDLAENKKYLTIYIDVKSLYDNSTPTFPSEIESHPKAKELSKYLIYSNLIKDIILKTKTRIESRVKQKFLGLVNIHEYDLHSVNETLQRIEDSIDDVFKHLDSSLVTSFRNTVIDKTQSSSSLGVGLSAKKGFGVNFDQSDKDDSSFKKEFDNTLVRYLDIKKCLIDNLIKIKELLNVKYLYIYLDDFSEIDKEAQILFMDWFIAPANNLSDDFVKFKIAAYPKRFYYGKLDVGKIDEISLDFFDAYYTFEKKDVVDRSRMEHLALDYTKRLIENRIKVYFPNDHWEQYFEIPITKLYSLLFDVSLNIPRKIGYILSYCYESCLIHNTAIGLTAIENASKRYYNDVTEKYFLVNEHICKPFEDKISNDNQYELLEAIIKRQYDNQVFLKRRKNKETSHFYVSNDLCYLLDNLELNGFVSTFNKTKDSNNVFSTTYSLDHGLCTQHSLTYGRFNTHKELNTSLALFNFNSLVIDFFNSTQVIKCEKSHEFHYSEIDYFKKFKMKCPTCLPDVSECTVVPKFKELKEKFAEDDDNEIIGILFQEFLILEFLRISGKSISTNRIAESLDISRTTISNFITGLIDKGLCAHDIEVSKELKREFVKITKKGVTLIDRVNVRIRVKKISI